MTERFRLLAAVHLFLLQDDAVLLLRRFNTGYEDGNYSVVAGHLDGDEDVIAAAIREAREETGIILAPDDVTVVSVMHRKATDERIDFFLAASRWTGAIRNMEPEKCGALTWFPRNALPENVIPSIRRALDNERHGRWFDQYGWPEQS